MFSYFVQTNLPLAGLFENCWKQTISRTRHDFAPPLPLCCLRLPNIYPLIRYFSGIQQHYWLQNRRGLRPGASGKSRTGDCALLSAVLDTSPVVYNPQRLVHEVNNLWQSSQRAQRSNSSNLKTEKIWTYDRTYKELLLACAANCVAGTVAGTILAITW